MRQPTGVPTLLPNEFARPDMRSAVYLNLTMEGGTMRRRTMQGMMYPDRLIADSAFGSGPMLGWFADAFVAQTG